MSEQEPSPLECRKIAELLGEYFDGTLPQRTRELLDWHIDSCPPCVAFVNTYRETIRATGRLPAGEVPRELKQRFLSFIRSRQ